MMMKSAVDGFMHEAKLKKFPVKKFVYNRV